MPFFTAYIGLSGPYSECLDHFSHLLEECAIFAGKLFAMQFIVWENAFMTIFWLQ